MPFYAFTNFNEDNATYTGFRMVEADWELGENETLIEADSLEGYSEALQNLPKSPQDKLRELTALISTLDNATQRAFLYVSRDVFVVLQAGNTSLAYDIVDDVETNGDIELEALKTAVLAILEA
jgi:hypothetical protein